MILIAATPGAFFVLQRKLDYIYIYISYNIYIHYIYNIFHIIYYIYMLYNIPLIYGNSAQFLMGQLLGEKGGTGGLRHLRGDELGDLTKTDHEGMAGPWRGLGAFKNAPWVASGAHLSTFLIWKIKENHHF